MLYKHLFIPHEYILSGIYQQRRNFLGYTSEILFILSIINSLKYSSENLKPKGWQLKRTFPIISSFFLTMMKQ